MRFNPLEHPVMFSSLNWLNRSTWLEHVPLGMLLVELQRPGVLVELGTFTGVSYCGFCQAVQELSLPTKCFAIDTWLGDAHVKRYPIEVLQHLRQHHDPLYGRFSTLVQKTFDDAVNDFADGSIDLLHIDGLHTYEAVKHDYETWRPKLSERAIVLFHDTAERGRDFGVYRFWEEICRAHPHFEFHHAHGLGILASGPAISPAIREFLEDANASPAAFRLAFAAIGERNALKPDHGEVANFLRQQQAMVNQWRQEFNSPLSVTDLDLASVMGNLPGFARDSISDSLSFLNQALNTLRARAQAR